MTPETYHPNLETEDTSIFRPGERLYKFGEGFFDLLEGAQPYEGCDRLSNQPACATDAEGASKSYYARSFLACYLI